MSLRRSTIHRSASLLALVCTLVSAPPLAQATPMPNYGPLPRGDAGWLRTISHPEMKAFWKLVDEHAAAKPLTGAYLLGVQHLLGSTGGLLRGIAASGIEPGNMLVLGKTYSQHDQAVADLRLAGFGVQRAAWEAGLDERLAGQYRPALGANARADEIAQAISAFVAAHRDSAARFVVVDDGGELIEALHRRFPELHRHIVAVEQTTRGLERVSKLDLAFPVVSVAGSKVKRAYESPMSGHSIAKTTLAKLSELKEVGVRVGDTTLVLGFGNVGRATASSLRDAGRDVVVFDTNPEARAAARKLGFETFDDLKDALPKGHVVVSTAGSQTLGTTDLSSLPRDAVLINGASSSTEFRPDRSFWRYSYTLPMAPSKLQRTARGRVFPINPEEVGRSSTLRTRRDWAFELGPRKRIIVANQGTVINFDGSVDPIPPRYIQLTRGLLYLATLQAAGLAPNRRGIVELDEALQNRWLAMVQEDLARTGESLESPRF